jgi:hypothetical protein
MPTRHQHRRVIEASDAELLEPAALTALDQMRPSAEAILPAARVGISLEKFAQSPT